MDGAACSPGAFTGLGWLRESSECNLPRLIAGRLVAITGISVNIVGYSGNNGMCHEPCPRSRTREPDRRLGVAIPRGLRRGTCQPDRPNLWHRGKCRSGPACSTRGSRCVGQPHSWPFPGLSVQRAQSHSEEPAGFSAHRTRPAPRPTFDAISDNVSDPAAPASVCEADQPRNDVGGIGRNHQSGTRGRRHPSHPIRGQCGLRLCNERVRERRSGFCNIW